MKKYTDYMILHYAALRENVFLLLYKNILPLQIFKQMSFLCVCLCIKGGGIKCGVSGMGGRREPLGGSP